MEAKRAKLNDSQIKATPLPNQNASALTENFDLENLNGRQGEISESKEKDETSNSLEYSTNECMKYPPDPINSNSSISGLPSNLWKEHNLNNSDRSYFQNPKVYEIDKKYENCVKDCDNYCAWGKDLVEIREFHKAIDKFKRALRIDEKHVKSLTGYGEALVELARFKEAVKKLEQALKIESKNVDALYNCAVAFFFLSRLEESKKMCDQALGIDQNDHRVFYILGVVYIHEGEFEEAQVYFKKSFAINPKVTNRLVHFADALLNMGEYDQAIETYALAHQIQKESVFPLYCWGFALTDKDEYEKAIQLFQKAPENSPSYYLIQMGWSRTLWHQGKMQDAFEYMNRAKDKMEDKGRAMAIHVFARDIQNLNNWIQDPKYHKVHNFFRRRLEGISYLFKMLKKKKKNILPNNFD